MLCGIALAKPGALVLPGVPVLVPAPRRPGWGLRTAALPSTHDGFMSGQWQGCLPPWIAGCAASHAGSLERPSTSFSRTRCACNGQSCRPCATNCDDGDDDDDDDDDDAGRLNPSTHCPLWTISLSDVFTFEVGQFGGLKVEKPLEYHTVAVWSPFQT